MDLTTIAVLVTQSLAPALSAPALSVPALDVPPADTQTAGPVLTSRFGIVAAALPPLPSAHAAPATLAPATIALPPSPDTLFEYSAAYYKRLDIHRKASYVMLPLFAFQYIAGSKLYDESFEAPEWARKGHRIAATGVAVLFSANTVTGLMNLYEGRKDPDERKRKIFHASMMLLADAGFLATGILSEGAERSSNDRDAHRAVALTSVTLATVGYLSMLDVFRRD